MLARSTTLRHPSGITFETPILVPSFSSKGFKLTINGENEVSEVTQILEIAKEFLTETVLVSAYDIYHGYIPLKYCFTPEVIFVDSGGYETADDYDLSTAKKYSGIIKNWDENMLIGILDSFPVHVAAVFVSFDHGSIRKPINEQIQSARELFAKYPNHLNDILLKPEKHEEQYLDLSSVIKYINELGDFDIIGVTEKELGNSLLKRMSNIARIRLALDEAKINVPIHVFGSLDPITSCLYFLAGAEIFDGLTWIRYSYVNGLSIYNQNYGAIKVGICETDELVRARALVDNIYYLRKLQYQMKDFLLEEDFAKFEYNEELLKRSYDTLCGMLGGGL